MLMPTSSLTYECEVELNGALYDGLLLVSNGYIMLADGSYLDAYTVFRVSYTYFMRAGITPLQDFNNLSYL